jgi:hypothetical protein
MTAPSWAASGAMPNRAEADAVSASMDANSATPIIKIRFMRFSSRSQDCDFSNKLPLQALFRYVDR